MAMKLLFIHGPAAVGKLTVARELGARTGWPVFHNHLIVDALLPVFPFGSPEFVELRERFWLETMERAAASSVPALIFTFAPEASVAPGFPERLVARIAPHGASVTFVSLTAPEPVIEQRVASETRRSHGKLYDPALYRRLRDGGAFRYPELPAGIQIDTALHPPAEAADLILQALGVSAPGNASTAAPP
jgi:hypothetical protein